MTITVEVTPDLERELQRAAQQAGLAPDAYILRLLEDNLQTRQSSASVPGQLPAEETELLQRVNASLSTIEWQRYQTLLAKRQAETLTADEQAELINLSDQMETANANRMQALAQLAHLRQTTLSALITQLGLKPVAHV